MENKMNSTKKIFSFNKKSMKYGSAALTFVVVFIGIAVALNFIAGVLDLKFDLTPNKLFSIGEKTDEILSKVDTDLTVYGLFDDKALSSGDPYKDFVSLLGQYQKKSSHIKVEYVDTDKNPTFIKKLDPKNLKTIQKQDFVFVSGNKIKVITSNDLYVSEQDPNNPYGQSQVTGSNAEQAFTGAIKYVTAKVTPTIYFVEGHDEIGIDSNLTTMKKLFENNNFIVKTYNSVTGGKVPTDATILIDVSPKRDMSIDEREKVLEFLQNGGKAYFMFDSDQKDIDLKNYNYILEKNNLSLKYDRIKETNPANMIDQGNPSVLLAKANQNDIIPQEMAMLLPNSRSIYALKETKEYIVHTTFVETESTAVGEMIDKARGNDSKGPLSIAIGAENKGYSKVYRLLAMGNASFITDSELSNNSSFYQQSIFYFYSTVKWLQGETDDVVISPKNFNTQKITVTTEQTLSMFFVTVVGFPIIILGLGIFIWFRRRHL